MDSFYKDLKVMEFVIPQRQNVILIDFSNGMAIRVGIRKNSVKKNRNSFENCPLILCKIKEWKFQKISDSVPYFLIALVVIYFGRIIQFLDDAVISRCV